MQRGPRVQVDSPAPLRPTDLPQGLVDSGPGVCLALAATIAPWAADPARPRPRPRAARCLVRHGLGVPRPLPPHRGPSPEGARGAEGAVSPSPLCPPRARLPQVRAGRVPLALACALPGCAPPAGQPQARPRLGWRSPAGGLRPCLAPACALARLLRRQRQLERLPALTEIFQIPPDFVVKYQALDIIAVICSPTW
jgi:hypothetical protein